MLGNLAILDAEEVIVGGVILRHYDRTSGQYVDLNPFGEKN